MQIEIYYFIDKNMKKLMMFLTIGFVSFNVSATEIYSCSFTEQVQHIIPGATIDEAGRKYLNSIVDTVKKGEASTVTYIIEGDKAFVKDSFDKVEATFLRSSFLSSESGYTKTRHNVSFAEKSDLFPSTTIISGDFAVKTTLIEESGFKGVNVYTSYGKCIKSIL